MVPRGLEPRTLRLLAVRSNQLSYETRARHPAGTDISLAFSDVAHNLRLLVYVPGKYMSIYEGPRNHRHLWDSNPRGETPSA